MYYRESVDGIMGLVAPQLWLVKWSHSWTLVWSVKDGIFELYRKAQWQRILLGLIISAAVVWAAAYQNVAAADPSSGLVLLSDSQEGCTIGVASGLVTDDGRPILWKVRDVTEEGRQQLVHIMGFPYTFIGVCTEGEGIYMGLNEIGVACGNSLVRLTSEPAPNSSIQNYILQTFSTIDQLEDYFRSGQQAEACQASGCFPFIDPTGNARIFEVERSNSLWTYNSLDLDRQAQGLYGFVIRANEFHMRLDGTDNNKVTGRYASGVHNVLGLIAKSGLSFRGLIQGAGDSQDYYEFIRYGPDRELEPIARPTTRSAVVVHGVLLDEDPTLATMWVLLGQTNFSIAVPTWARVSEVPKCLGRGLIYDRAKSLWAKGNEKTIQASIFPLEAHMFHVVTETFLPHWRAYGVPDIFELTRIENRMADDAYSLLDCLDRRKGDNQAPTVSFTAWPDDLTLVFSVDWKDPDSSIIALSWDFGDGARSSDSSVSHTYGQPGTYLVSCTVTDDSGVNVTDWRYYQVPVNINLLGNKRINMADLASLASFWQQEGCGEPDWCTGADLDRSGTVDFDDLLILTQNWLCGPTEQVR